MLMLESNGGKQGMKELKCSSLNDMMISEVTPREMERGLETVAFLGENTFTCCSNGILQNS